MTKRGLAYGVSLTFLAAAGLFGLPNPGAAQTETAAGQVLERVISETERQVIEEYYRRRERDRAAATDADYNYDDDFDEEYDRGGGQKPKKKKKANRGGGDDGGLPRGLAERDRLPPGLEMQLERGGRLPPGLEKRGLPSDLDAHLYDWDGSADRHIVGSDVVLVDTVTGVILDVLRDVVTGSQY